MLPSPYDLAWPPRRIVLHWTAGAPNASQNDRKHYHYLIDQLGNVVEGFPKLGANCANLTGRPSWSHDHQDGYAAHTRRFNSWSMGVSLCGMHDAVEGGDIGPFPLQPIQAHTLIGFLAGACEKYGLWPTEHRVMTHEEVQRLHGIPQPGKWDIRWLPTDTHGTVTGDAVGPWIRKRIMGAMPV
jgi:N-acetyl-anhydromuramyl-L-alanine amidase AmpD